MAQRQSRSFTLSFLSVSLLTLSSVILRVHASAVSTSIFPNSACVGATTSDHGLVGVGTVVLSSGEIETHCGCPSDTLPSFKPCPTSYRGESVCKSILNLDTGSFAASCGIVECEGSSCLSSKIVNTLVIDEDDCFNGDKGAIGYTTDDGDAKCGCAKDSVAFTACASPANGKATCVSKDMDFLGSSTSHDELVSCGVVCNKGYYLTPGGSCTKVSKRQVIGSSSRGFHTSTSVSTFVPTDGPIKVISTSTGSRRTSFTPTGGPIKVGPSPTSTYSLHQWNPHFNSSRAHSSSSRGNTDTGIFGTPTQPIKVISTSSIGASQHHHHSNHNIQTSFPTATATNFIPTGPIKVVPSPPIASTTATGPGASQSARFRLTKREIERQMDEVIFVDEQCAQSQRICPVGAYGNFECVRLDDVRQCGGCGSTGDGVDCLAIQGVANAVCIRSSCKIRTCEEGFKLHNNICTLA